MIRRVRINWRKNGIRFMQRSEMAGGGGRRRRDGDVSVLPVESLSAPCKPSAGIIAFNQHQPVREPVLVSSRRLTCLSCELTAENFEKFGDYPLLASECITSEQSLVLHLICFC